MARFLFVVPPLTGHVNPTVALGHALSARGHTVAWVGHPTAVRPLLAPGATLFSLPEDDTEGHGELFRRKLESARGLRALKQLIEEFLVPLGRGMLPGVEAAIAEFRPDVLLVDQQALAGALAARRRSLRWATLATTSARFADSLGGLPKVRSWVDEQLAALEREAGLSPLPDPDMSPDLVLVFSSEILAGHGRFPPQTVFVGPALEGRRDAVEFPWDRLAPGERLLVSLGTVNAERGGVLYRLLEEALADEPIQVILAAPPSQLPSPPSNFLVRSRLPQLSLLPQVRAVICHGGHNTVCEALAHGLPLLVLPIRDDQPVIAEQVVAAGAGLRLRFGRTSAAEIRGAVHRLLHDSSLRDGAARIRESFERAGGTHAAAAAVEALA